MKLRCVVGCQWWMTLTVRLAVALLEFEFGNEASCSALIAFAHLIQRWYGSMNMYSESYYIFVVNCL